MKHEFLRRLSALALALVMAASLCAPARAAGDEGSGSDGEATTRSPKLSTQIIVLPNDKDDASWPLTISGLKQGDRVQWKAPNSVSLGYPEAETPDSEAAVTVGTDGTATVNVQAGESNAARVIEVCPSYPDESGGYTDGDILSCYVYRGRLPIQPPDVLNNVPADKKEHNLEIPVTEHAELFSAGVINIGKISSSVASIGEVTYDSGREKFTVPITGLKPGKVPITMTVTGGYQVKWELTVVEDAAVSVTNVMVSPNVLELTEGETHPALTATVIPSNASNKAVTWSVQNPTGKTVVEVDQETGKITAKEPGAATITATPADGKGGKTGACTVTVKESASGMTLEPASLVLDIRSVSQGGASGTGTIAPALSGANKDRVEIKWTTSNASIADFDGNGLNNRTTNNTAPVVIHGRKGGSATITAAATFKDKDGKTTATRTAACTVSVLDNDSVFITGLTLSEDKHSMVEGGSFKLSVKSVTPASAPVKDVTWESGNESIVKVKPDGTVEAVGAGQTIVTATAVYGSGAQAFCVVTVNQKAETIRLSFNYDSNTSGNKYTYTFGDVKDEPIKVTAILGPTGGAYPPADPIHWSSKNDSVAAVPKTTSPQITVKAVGAGRTTISAVPKDADDHDRENVEPAVITVTVSGVTIVNDDAAALTSLPLVQGQRRQISAQIFGSANNGDPSVDWISNDPSIVSVSTKNGATTTLTARSEGTARITASKGTYTVHCDVTVSEDTAGVIEGISTPPGVAYEFSNLTSGLQSACSTKTGASLAYVTNLSVSSTDQGILHDNHYSSDDTGAGVGVQDRYYPGTAPQGQRSLNDLSFVPRTTFSGTAEISYTAWSTDNQSVNGVIRIAVNGTGDVMYSANAGSVVHFQASDFSRIHSNLRSVSFTPPLESAGILYYKYTTSSQPGTRVTASDVYGRTGTPNLDDVSFVPAAGYQGTVKISYKGTDTSGRTISGVVTVNVTNASGSGSTPADISYSVQKESWVTFRPSDFSTACRYAMGESLSYVRFTQPPSGEGALFYNYKGFSDFDGTVASATSYYYSGTPALSRVSFVPTTTTPSQVDIPYTGYTTRGNTFTGTVHISLGRTNSAEQGGVYYTVFTGRSVNFNAGDFNAACLAALGRNLASIQFDSLPGTSQGTLRFTWGNSSTPSSVSTGTRFLRTGSSTSNLIGNVFFQANSSYTGTFTIPFTGTSDNGATFTDVVTIVVTPPASREITYSGTTANPIRLYSSHVVSAAYGALDGTLSYITFNNLPDITAGKLYINYSGLGTGTQVTTGTRYYISGSPGIDQICFVPRGRCSGQVGVGYTAVNTSGQSVSGRIMFNITSTGNSSFFNDMGSHTWAAPSVDYLYQNGVVKGTTATTFGPSRRIKRCDFVLMLCRAFRFNGSNGYSFADVPVNSYYSQAVATAKQLGIISGDGVNFHPNSELTRQDAMVMIYNALNAAGWNVAPASASVLNQFTDSGSVSIYARNAVSALVQLGAVTGSTSGRLNPRSPITRAEAAIILHFIMTM